jgi:hypothetical protein
MRVVLPNQPGGTVFLPGDVVIHSRKLERRDLVGQPFPGHTEVVNEDRGRWYYATGGNVSCDDKGSQWDGAGVCLKYRDKQSTKLPIVAVLRHEDV